MLKLVSSVIFGISSTVVPALVTANNNSREVKPQSVLASTSVRSTRTTVSKNT